MSWNGRGGSIPATLLLLACSRGEELDATYEGATSGGTVGVSGADALMDADEDDVGQVRLLHLSPDAGAVDVHLDGNPGALLTNVTYLQGTGYLEVPSGHHTFAIAPAGAGIEGAVLEVELEVEDDTAYSATAFGTVRNGTLGALALVDDTSGIDDDEVRLKVAHTAEGVGVVDLLDLSDDDTEVLAQVTFGDSAALDVDGGARTLGVDLDDDGNWIEDWRFGVPDLGVGALVNVYAVADRNDGVFLVAQLPDGAVAVVRHDPRVRVLHASPETPNVDVYARGALAFEDVRYPESTGYASLDASTQPFDVLPTGEIFGSRAPALSFDVPVELGLDYTAIVWGNSQPFVAPVMDSTRDLEPGFVRFQLIHGAEGAPTLDLRDANTGAPIVTNFSPGDVERVDLPAGAYAVGLDIGQDGSSDLVFDVPDLGGDRLVNVVAVRELDEIKLVAQLPNHATAVIEPR